MLDDDIRKLAERSPRRSMDGLEANIWAGVEAREQVNRASRIVYSYQAGVLAIGLLTSIAVGAYMAPAAGSPNGPDVLSMRTDLAPSARLIGY